MRMIRYKRLGGTCVSLTQVWFALPITGDEWAFDVNFLVDDERRKGLPTISRGFRLSHKGTCER